MKRLTLFWFACAIAGCTPLDSGDEQAAPGVETAQAPSEDAPPVAVATPPEAPPPVRTRAPRIAVKPRPAPPSEQVAPLRKQLKHEDRYIREAAVCRLSALQAREAIPDIAALLQDPDDALKVYAITALADLEATAEVPRIRPFLGDRNSAIQLAATGALLELEDEESLPKILAMTQDRKLAIRWDVTRLVGMNGLSESGPIFLKLLEDEAAQGGAIMALGCLRLPEAGDHLLPLLKKTQLQPMVIEALGAIDARKYTPEIRKLMGMPDLKVVSAIALARAQDTRALGILRDRKVYSWMNFYSAPELVRTLDERRIPLRHVRNHTIAQVAQSISEDIGLPVEFSASVDQQMRDASFAMSVGSLGCPSCFTVLSSLGGTFLEDARERLEWIASPDKGIRIVTVQEAEEFWKQFKMPVK